MTSTPSLRPPSSARYRLTLLWRTLRTLVSVEASIRSASTHDLCQRFGLEFWGFARPTSQAHQGLTWDVENTWWAVEVVLARWPFARDRQCLRRSLVLGSQLRARRPALLLEVTSLDPFAAHAWIMVSGHGLDLGPAGAMVSTFDATDEGRRS